MLFCDASEETRNEMYVTLIGGDFSHGLKSEKNIELKLSVVDSEGRTLPNVCFLFLDSTKIRALRC